MIVLGIDPGREKCGVAVVSPESVLVKKVVTRDGFSNLIQGLIKEHNVEQIVLGDGTGSQDFLCRLGEIVPNFSIATVDEHLTTEQARERYWHDHKPKGIKRLLPLTLQLPPEPYDDYVAVILAERYLKDH